MLTHERAAVRPSLGTLLEVSEHPLEQDKLLVHGLT
jgi:hypothetical protein